MLRRVLLFSRLDVSNATLQKRVVHTRLVQILTVFLAESLVKPKVTVTLMPTRRRVLNGLKTPCLTTWKTQRNISQVPRWPSVVLRRLRIEMTLLLILRKPVLKTITFLVINVFLLYSIIPMLFFLSFLSHHHHHHLC